MGSQIDSALRAERKSDTVFGAILNSDLPPAEVTPTRLQHEAISLVVAGIETTTRALSLACFHIISSLTITERLHVELVEAVPDAEAMPSYEDLASLPYLTACIEESEWSIQRPR